MFLIFIYLFHLPIRKIIPEKNEVLSLESIGGYGLSIVATHDLFFDVIGGYNLSIVTLNLPFDVSVVKRGSGEDSMKSVHTGIYSLKKN